MEIQRGERAHSEGEQLRNGSKKSSIKAKSVRIKILTIIE